MRDKLVIITNESIYLDKSKKYFCDNIDLKSIPEELNNFTEVIIIGRFSKIRRAKEIKVKISIHLEIFFLFCISFQKMQA